MGAAGGAIGARAARQAGAGWPLTRSVGFTALLLVLGLVIWSAFTVMASRLTDGRPSRVLGFLGASFATPAFVAWLLFFLVMATAVYGADRPAPTRQANRSA